MGTIRFPINNMKAPRKPTTSRMARPKKTVSSQEFYPREEESHDDHEYSAPKPAPAPVKPATPATSSSDLYTPSTPTSAAAFAAAAAAAAAAASASSTPATAASAPVSEGEYAPTGGLVMHLSEMQGISITELSTMAMSYNVENPSSLRKNELICEILKKVADQNGTIHGEGVLEILSDGYGFLRSGRYNYRPCPEDI